MSYTDVEERTGQQKSAVTADHIRESLVDHAKVFKTSWVKLGQAIYPVWKDKLFYAWGFEKFEYYTQRELGIKKSTALKLLKTYFFLEQEEPVYLNENFTESRSAEKVPECDALNVLRMAKRRPELTKDDYQKLRKAIFDKGYNATSVRQDLTSIMKERKPVDPDEEREKRNTAALKKLANAIKSFQKDMDALQMAPAELIEGAAALMQRIQEQVD